MITVSIRNTENGKWYSITSNDKKLRIGLRNPSKDDYEKALNEMEKYEKEQYELYKKEKEKKEKIKETLIRIGLDIITTGIYEIYYQRKNKN